MLHKGILILDFGSQYTQLIARKIRELNYYAEIQPFSYPIEEIKANLPKGIILSGGPSSVYDSNAPKINDEIFHLGIPVLGICYGLQMMSHLLGGKVEPAQDREYGKAHLKILQESSLFASLPDKSVVWMSHGDKVLSLPDGFVAIGETESSPFAAIANEQNHWYGVQFHPEVAHTEHGITILQNFASRICHAEANWSMENYAEEKIREIRKTVGKERVLLGLSGGVDSTVTAKLLYDAIGKQLTCVYVDTGLMRLNETEAVVRRFRDYFGMELIVVHSEERFLEALSGVSDPEQKRKIIGKLFLEEFKRATKDLPHHEFLAQGTLYTDVIESVSVKGPSETIKSHHNRVKEVMELIQAGKVIEPLNELFKDEVRALGEVLGIPEEMLYRHPFPGPGLAIRILGEISKEKLDVLRKADYILLEELKTSGLYKQIWQAFAVFLPVKAVGVMGDKRTYQNVIALRMVESTDGMTADFAKVPYDVLGKISSRIINEVDGINRVVYDISSKPPATIEWE
ncbi:MAG: glutamine-hydrolyzing GMP synthase [Candidatus Hydrogenedentota bacterium]|nr:MAG: glutamine-hydrolyzing GMP synthase [Candidatus Hydrogenedentota bacterium]